MERLPIHCVNGRLRNGKGEGLVSVLLACENLLRF